MTTESQGWAFQAEGTAHAVTASPGVLILASPTLKLKLAPPGLLLIGRLGLGTRESHSCPQQVLVPPGQEAQRVICGIDSSVILTVPGRVLACGSNR